MRVTNTMMLKTLTDGIYKVTADLMKNQEKLSSGKQINRVSDDPVAFGEIMEHKDLITALNQYSRNIDYATEQLEHVETSTSKFTDSLIRIKELAVSMATGTASTAGRQNTVYEVQLLQDHLIDTANANVNNKYLFSGFKTDVKPFDAAGTYAGDSNERALNIAPGTRFVHGFSGERIFKGVGNPTGADIFQIVTDFVTALNNDDTAAIQASVGQIDDAIRQIGDATSEIGARISRLQVQKQSTNEFLLQTKTLLSDIEDTDITEVAIALSYSQNSLEALQMTTAKFSKLSIFNFI